MTQRVENNSMSCLITINRSSNWYKHLVKISVEVKIKWQLQQYNKTKNIEENNVTIGHANFDIDSSHQVTPTTKRRFRKVINIMGTYKIPRKKQPQQGTGLQRIQHNINMPRSIDQHKEKCKYIRSGQG